MDFAVFALFPTSFAETESRAVHSPVSQLLRPILFCEFQPILHVEVLRFLFLDNTPTLGIHHGLFILFLMDTEQSSQFRALICTATTDIFFLTNVVAGLWGGLGGRISNFREGVLS